MHKVNIKRKYTEESVETVKSCKRLKLSEIIQTDINKEESNSSHCFQNINKKRSKMLTAMHLKKRYKYYCKKHNAAYLMESRRKKGKEYSKESRNKFIQSFRTLSVSQDIHNISENETIPNKCMKNPLKDEIHLNINVKEYNESSPTSFTEIENAIKNVFGENAENDFSSDDSDFNSEYDEARFKKQRQLKFFSVKSNVHSNGIIFSENDSDETDFDEETSDCDCYYHEKLKNMFDNYVYELSSDEDTELHRQG